jgi:large subunit ribosomal protein L28
VKWPESATLVAKKPMFGNQIARARAQYVSGRTKHKQLPNLQRVRIQTETGNRRVRVCVRCIRSGKIVKVISGAGQAA